MRNFRNAALASATALAIAATGTTAAFADGEKTATNNSDQGKDTCYQDRDQYEKGGPLDVLFKGTACEGDKEVKDIISDGFKGLRNDQGSSQFLPKGDREKEFDITDAAGKETYWKVLPQWARLWIDATAITGIGAFVGLVIAGVNFASYNGLVQLPEFPLPQF
ncbi:putative membrane protein [Corynebacterium mucifaciens]|uniref:hypothetical protein n=1 Tax=Corynebacterium ureicelerivorans TaxID=401472 RepID=UPI002352D6F4|nr:hypothetical protein [Corynebacterium ureicelerivorans]MDN8625460.1 hypothetical protein [Corynebacterium ureicelerivorans]